jgi:signal transduction histidine kinase
MNSIQSRLATGLTASLALVFLILWIVVSNNIQKLSENYIASRIEHDIETLLTAVTFDKKNNVIINDQYINTVYKQPFSGHYYVIEYNSNKITSRSLWDQDLTHPEITQPGYQKSIQTGPQHQSLMTLSRRFKKQDHNITISIAEDLTPVIEDIRQFKNDFAIMSLILLTSLLLLQVLILRRGLKPLRAIHNELNEMEKGAITQLSTNVPYELSTVVEEVNHLSASLHKRLKRSRDALSDLSHAIKKPLTLLQQFSDKNQSTFDETENTFLKNQINEIQLITDRILKRARIAGITKPKTPFDIKEDLPLLIKTIRTMYPGKDIKVNLATPQQLQTRIDREDMLELLGNLVENAWKWTNHTLDIIIMEDEDLSITIEDDGPGSNTDSLNELIQRGVRLDESVSGYGFGLAISADIIRDYAGRIEFGRSESLGGFKVNITLPTHH